MLTKALVPLKDSAFPKRPAVAPAHVAFVSVPLFVTFRDNERVAADDSGRGIYFAAAEDLSHVEFGDAIAHALGRKRARVVHLPEWALRAIGLGGDVVSRIRHRPGWIGRDKIAELLAGSWTCSSAKARRQLGWLPAAPLADRLAETAQWYRDARWL